MSATPPRPTDTHDRRKQYRVTTEFDELVKIELLGPKVHARNVRLLDLSAGGAGIELPEHTGGLLRIRDRIELSMLSPKLPTDIKMDARVCYLDERGARPKVGLAFESWREHRILLDSELRTLFNEREAYRVEPAVQDPLVVELHARGGRLVVHGGVRDLSVLGFGLWVPTSALEHLRDGASIDLHLSFPGDDGGLVTPAQVRYLQADGARTRALVGLRLPDGPTVGPRVRQAITRFVMERQRELLRMGLREDDTRGLRVSRS